MFPGSGGSFDPYLDLRHSGRRVIYDRHTRNWRTSDGRMFLTGNEALLHQIRLDNGEIDAVEDGMTEGGYGAQQSGMEEFLEEITTTTTTTSTQNQQAAASSQASGSQMPAQQQPLQMPQQPAYSPSPEQSPMPSAPALQQAYPPPQQAPTSPPPMQQPMYSPPPAQAPTSPLPMQQPTYSPLPAQAPMPPQQLTHSPAQFSQSVQQGGQSGHSYVQSAVTMMTISSSSSMQTQQGQPMLSGAQSAVPALQYSLMQSAQPMQQVPQQQTQLQITAGGAPNEDTGLVQQLANMQLNAGQGVGLPTTVNQQSQQSADQAGIYGMQQGYAPQDLVAQYAGPSSQTYQGGAEQQMMPTQQPASYPAAPQAYPPQQPTPAQSTDLALASGAEKPRRERERMFRKKPADEEERRQQPEKPRREREIMFRKKGGKK